MVTKYTYATKVRLFKKLSLISTITIGIVVFGILMVSIIQKTNPLLFGVISRVNFFNLKQQLPYVSGITTNNIKYFFEASNLNNNLVSFISTKETQFSNPKLLIDFPGADNLEIRATEGNFNAYKQEIYLYNDVSIVSDQSYSLFLTDVLFNFNTSSVVSNNPFKLISNNNEVNGTTIEIINNKTIKTNYFQLINPEKQLTVTANYAEINDTSNRITLSGDVEIQSPQYRIIANLITANYKNIKRFQLTSLNDFTRIAAKGGVEIIVGDVKSNNTTKLFADEYVYDVTKDIMILRNLNNKQPVILNSAKYSAVVNDRIEYQPSKSLIVLRGNPIIKYNDYEFNAKLITITIDENKKIKSSEFFDDVVIYKDDTTIKADYGFFNDANQIIRLEDNIVLSNNSGMTKGCNLTIDLQSGELNLVACDEQNTKIEINK